MWTCPNCNRNFATTNQSHTCSSRTVGEIFMDKPDQLVLIYAAILEGTETWKPNSIGAAKHAVVFTNKKAWLIIKPMSKVLDIKFYTGHEVVDKLIHKSTLYYGKYAHHIRFDEPEQLTADFFKLIRQGFDYAME